MLYYQWRNDEQVLIQATEYYSEHNHDLKCSLKIAFEGLDSAAVVKM